MSLQLDTLPKKGLKGQIKVKAEEIGGCPVCKRFIFSDQDYGRAPKPLLGKAHIDPCGGVPS